MLGNNGNMQYLHIDDNPIKDISVLKNFPYLKELTLSNTLVTDISVLKELKGLTTLDLKGCPVSNEDLFALEEALPYTGIKYTLEENREMNS